MILKSFQILAICTSMAVTPSNFHYDQVKKETSESQFTLDSNCQSVSETQTWITEYETQYFVRHRKETGQSVYNSALAVKTYNYIQTTRNGDYDDDAIIPTEQTLNISKYTNALFTYEITPYKYLKNVHQATSIQVFLINDYYIDPETNLGNIVFRYKVLTSTDSYWQRYIDMSNYSSNSLNYDIYADLTNPENGFIYNEQIIDVPVTKTGDINISVAMNTNIEIVTDKTNYVLIYMVPYVKDYTSTPYVTMPTKYNNSFVSAWEGKRLVRITGTMIDGNINYEVVDIPGIMWEVLSMPFTFISIAFNLTLFPGTPYQVNLSNLFLSILGALIFIFIMSKFVFKK